MPYVTGLASGIDTDQLISELMQLERRPLQLMQERVNTLEQKRNAYRDINSRLSNLLSRVDDLLKLSAFQTKATQSSNELVATATADTSAVPGSYTLSVGQLAQNHRIASDAQADTTSALGLSGTVQINGVDVTIDADMSLSDIADAINEAEAGVQASILENTLILESTEAGTSNSIQLVDSGGSLVVDATSDTPTVVTASAENTAQAGSYSVDVTQLATRHQVVGDNWLASDVGSLGWSGTFAINGVEVTIEVGDSLQDIRDKVNASGAGVTATIQESGGQYRMVWTSNTFGSDGEIIADDVTGDLLENNGLLNFTNVHPTLGVQWENETQAAVNAQFSVDGVDYIRTSNTISDVIDGVTLNLEGTGTAAVSVTRSGGGGPLADLGLLDSNDQVKNELQAAQDSEFTINGLAVTRGSNTVNDLVSGVTFNLKAAGSATVTIDRDVQNAIDEINAFVKQYNSVQSFIGEKTAKEALLQSDSTAVRLQSNLRTRTTDRVSVPSDFDYDSLSIIGISVDKTGVMSVDESKLRKALEENPDQVQKLFAAKADTDGFDGAATRLREYIRGYTTSGTGILSSRDEMLKEQMETIEDSMERFEARLAMREEYLVRQFTEMEKALASFQTMSTALAGQITQLAGFMQ